MDIPTILMLNELNKGFYRAHSSSFSSSRRSPWKGWFKLIPFVGEIFERIPDGDPLRVLDIASGNQRFERFLHDSFPDRPFSFTCIDAEAFPAEDLEVDPIMLDVIGTLAAQGTLTDEDGLAGGYDLVSSFGFLHHVPSHDLRLLLMGELIDLLSPNGILVIAFWRFADDPKLSAKANAVTMAAAPKLRQALELGDHLLDWNGDRSHLRYCHSFDDAELKETIDALKGKAELLARFKADGQSDSLNEYLLWQKLP